jgi:hypothetical protein
MNVVIIAALAILGLFVGGTAAHVILGLAATVAYVAMPRDTVG